MTDTPAIFGCPRCWPAAAPTTTQLNALGPGRRSLRRDYPKGDTKRVFWATGLTVR